MRDKNVAALLAFFLGWIGVHRFYLGQTGLGIVYLLLCWTSIPFWISLLDGILFLATDKKIFDAKYNYMQLIKERERFDNEHYKKKQPTQKQQSKPIAQHETAKKPIQKTDSNPYKTNGINKFKEFDFEGAIADFKKALSINSKDIAVHFNIACAYSMEEQANEAFFHLSKAVEFGFVEFERIHNHDSLAFVRTRDEFEQFVKNGYKLISADKLQQEEKLEALKKMATQQPPVAQEPPQNNNVAPPQTPPKPDIVAEEVPEDLLEQFKKLEEFRKKGFLTDAQLEAQKKKLLG